jgi:hypothetical protein
MSASNSVETLVEKLTEALNDAQKHDRGVDAAGARLRKRLQDVSVCCKELRAEVQEERNSRKNA